MQLLPLLLLLLLGCLFLQSLHLCITDANQSYASSTSCRLLKLLNCARSAACCSDSA
jgi:hypothetical protein